MVRVTQAPPTVPTVAVKSTRGGRSSVWDTPPSHTGTETAGSLSPFSAGPFNAAKPVAALLSSDNRWTNGFCHLTSPRPPCTPPGRHTRTTNKSLEHSRSPGALNSQNTVFTNMISWHLTQLHIQCSCFIHEGLRLSGCGTQTQPRLSPWLVREQKLLA